MITMTGSRGVALALRVAGGGPPWVHWPRVPA